MGKIMSFRKPVLLPFPETQLRAGSVARITSTPAAGKLRTAFITIADECRPHVRLKVYEQTSGKFVAAELVERLEVLDVLKKGETFEIEVESTRDCLFVAAVKCLQLFDDQQDPL